MVDSVDADVTTGRDVHFQIGCKWNRMRVCLQTEPSPASRGWMGFAPGGMHGAIGIRLVPAAVVVQLAAGLPESVGQQRIQRMS